MMGNLHVGNERPELPKLNRWAPGIAARIGAAPSPTLLLGAALRCP